jgi:mono/diheme cytochrome c family protein
MRVAHILTRGAACAAAVAAVACGTSEKRAAAGDTGGAARTAAGGATSVAMRTFNGDEAVAKQGRELFLKFNCYGCHGGLAGGAMGPSLRDTVWKFGGSESAIFNSIHHGRPAGMPTWSGTLSPQQIKTLVVYIRSLRTTAEPKFFWASQATAAPGTPP